jgi:uncharacterized protein YbaR (Trm112 family)
MALSKELLDILVCPVCRERVQLADDDSGLVCGPCRLKYPIQDGIPVMLVDEAEKIGSK